MQAAPVTLYAAYSIKSLPSLTLVTTSCTVLHERLFIYKSLLIKMAERLSEKPWQEVHEITISNVYDY